MAYFFIAVAGSKHSNSYKDRYSATATFRADGTSRVAYNNRWGFFPSLALAWRLSDERCFDDKKWISNLKLRAGYGVIGNQNIPAYQSYNTYDIDYAVINGELVTATNQNMITNENLKWETTESFNVGLDFGFLKGRISGSVDIYQKNTRDLILDAMVPATLGVDDATMYQNSGSIRNRGVEFSINTVNLTGKFKWNTSFNIAHNSNVVTDLGGVDEILIGSDASSQAVLKVGQPVGLWYGWKTTGVWQESDFYYAWDNGWSAHGSNGKTGYQQYKYMHLDSNGQRGSAGYYLEDSSRADVATGSSPGQWKYEDVNKDGVINDDDRQVIGVSQPKFTGAITNSFSYKNFDLNVMFDFSYGKEMFNAVRYSLMESTQSYVNRISGDYWRPTVYSAGGRTVKDEYNGAIVEATGVGYGDVAINGNPSTTQAFFGANTNSGGYVTSNYIEDASYIRLKSVTLGYIVPTKITSKLGIDNLRIYVQGLNLFTLTPYSGYDPTVNSSSLSGTRLGYDNNYTPSSRIVKCGANITF